MEEEGVLEGGGAHLGLLFPASVHVHRQLFSFMGGPVRWWVFIHEHSFSWVVTFFGGQLGCQWGVTVGVHHCAWLCHWLGGVVHSWWVVVVSYCGHS